MLDQIKRISWSLVDMPSIPALEMAKLFVPAYEYGEFEYYVHASSSSSWSVVKCEPGGPALASYDLNETKKGLTCDCPSGWRQLQCRHREMVLDSMKIMKAPEPIKITRDTAALLASADKLLEDFKKLKKEVACAR